jgi:hypothetical protein
MDFDRQQDRIADLAWGRRPMSFQITILKVLAGQREGRLPLAELRRDVAILISSGRDWMDRTKRIAARAPGLDIFSEAFVVRDIAGWQITAAGRALLMSIEAPASSVQDPAEIAEAASLPPSSEPSVPVIGVNQRRSRRRRRSDRKVAAKSAA